MADSRVFSLADGVPPTANFAERLVLIHQRVCQVLRCEVGRIAVAMYDPDTDELKTYAYSDFSRKPLHLYSARLSDVPSLKDLAETGMARVVNDLGVYADHPSQHSRVIGDTYLASLTIPMKRAESLYGFVFFNADTINFFTPEVLERLMPYGQMLAAMALLEFEQMRTLKAAVLTARQIGHLRDDETGAHLQRMAAYTRLIAVKLAPALGHDDAWVEMLTHFAPLHDLGKISVPDSVLFKPGPLDDSEFTVMRQHVEAGVQIVEMLLRNFAVHDDRFSRILHDVVAYHHETLDGLGYPYAIGGETVPIEARIVAVADIFDALTSERPYKHAWTVDEALAHLAERAGTKLDASCIQALADSRDEIERVRGRFSDEP